MYPAVETSQCCTAQQIIASSVFGYMLVLLQTPLPGLMVSAGSLGLLGCSTCVYLPADPPSRLGWGIGPARPPLRGHVVDVLSSILPAGRGYTGYEIIRKDELVKSPPNSQRVSGPGHVVIGPVVRIESPAETDGGKRDDSTLRQQLLSQQIRPSRMYTNLHAFFDRARHFADIVKKAPKQARGGGPSLPKRRASIGGDKSRTLFISISSKMAWDEELAGPLEKKKTWIHIPEISISAPELLPLLEAVPVRCPTRGAGTRSVIGNLE